MEILSDTTQWIRIYMCGDYDIAKLALRKYCLKKGLCVTLSKCDYIYTGGAEDGFVVGLNRYPRFKSNKAKLLKHASEIGSILMNACGQQSYMIQDPENTTWYSRRKDISDSINVAGRDKSTGSVAN